MTRPSVDTEHGIIGSRPVRDETGDTPLWTQREMAPEVARVEFRGPSTHARKEAHAKAEKSLGGRRATILQTLRAHGPLDRWKLHEVTGLPENSVNSAVNALMKSNHVHLLAALDPVSGRSVVALTEEG